MHTNFIKGLVVFFLTVCLSGMASSQPVVKDTLKLSKSQLDQALGNAYYAPINVKSPPFNAKGDGSTNDGSAILSAVAAARAMGGAAYLPAGRYSVPSGLDLSDSNTVLIGAAPGEYNQATNTFGKGTIIIGYVNFTGKNSRMSNITVSNPSGGDVVSTSGDNSVFENCRFVGRYAFDSYHSFLSGGATGVDVINCKSYKNVHGFAFRSSNVKVVNCEADSNGNNGLIIKSGDGETNHNIQVTGFNSYHQPVNSVGVRIQVDANAASTLSNVSLSNIVVDSSATSLGMYIENDYGDYTHMRNIGISGGTIRGSSVVMYQASNVLISGMSIYNGAFGLDTCRNVLFSGCAVDHAPSYSFYAYNGSDSIYALGCTSKYPAGLNDAVGIRYYSVNDVSALGSQFLTSIPDTGVNSGGLSGNLRLVTKGVVRHEGLGPWVTFTPPSQTGSTSAGETQAGIVGAPDNSTNNQSSGQLSFRVKDYWNNGSGWGWNWRKAMTLHSGGDLDIGKDGFYQNYAESKLRLFATDWDWYLFKGFKLSDSVNATISIDTAGNIVSAGNITVTGNAQATTFNGNTPISLATGKMSFSANVRKAVYMPGLTSDDAPWVSWCLTAEGSLTGGNIWCSPKTDSLIVQCTTTCSNQFTYGWGK